jgi:hypothetical protein
MPLTFNIFFTVKLLVGAESIKRIDLLIRLILSAFIGVEDVRCYKLTSQSVLPS